MGMQGCWRPVAASATAAATADQTDYPPRPMQVKCYHFIWSGLAIVFHFVDLGTDVNVITHYFRNDERGYAYATIVIILVPSFIISCVSYQMFDLDRNREGSHKWNRKLKLRIAMHVIPLALLLRCIDSLKYAWKSWRTGRQRNTGLQEKYYKLMLKEDADCALLQVLKCFLESAPQLVLQVSYIFKWVNSEKPLEPGWTGYDPLISAVSSFLGMAWCLRTFKNSIRYVQEGKDNIGSLGNLFIFLWHFFIAISRISMLSAMLYISWAYTLIAMAIHWIIMTVSLLRIENHVFCTSDTSVVSRTVTFLEKLSNNFLTTVFAVVSIFTYIPLDEGDTCIRYTCYYSLCFLENLLGASIWYWIEGRYWFKVLITVLCILPFILGCSCMVVYYHWFHPKEHRISNGNVIVEKGQVENGFVNVVGQGENGVVNVVGQGENGQGDDGSEMQEICLSEKL
ncbi:XK-related protein 6-like [Thrips palmi]|uniref:XK-related protein n=1 Tax=Thrips palmi TaxID=161013 RepID=A0A6P8Y2M1_THRPL|nr:XK-related protein 6-like [Thrips palmi]